LQSSPDFRLLRQHRFASVLSVLCTLRPADQANATDLVPSDFSSWCDADKNGFIANI